MEKINIFKKLKITEAQNKLVIDAPKEYADLFKDFKNIDFQFDSNKKNGYDFVQIFATEQEELEKLVLENADAGKYDCYYWACYPKGGGKIKSNIKRDTVWKAFELIKLRPVTQIAIDETWSALRARPSERVGK